MIYFLLNPPISPSQTQPGDPPPGRATRRAVRPARVTVGTAPLHPHPVSVLLSTWLCGKVVRFGPIRDSYDRSRHFTT